VPHRDNLRGAETLDVYSVTANDMDETSLELGSATG
jgi:hypothetical protein